MTKEIEAPNLQQSDPTQVSTVGPDATTVRAGERGSEAPGKSTGQPNGSGDEAIRSLAHSKWEAAGCPEGDGFAFWLEAEQELRAEPSGSSLAQASE